MSGFDVDDVGVKPLGKMAGRLFVTVGRPRSLDEQNRRDDRVEQIGIQRTVQLGGLPRRN